MSLPFLKQSHSQEQRSSAMDNRVDLLHSDIKEVKQDVKELMKLSAVHNEILRTHEQRSTQLEERFQPIEQIYVFAAKSAVAISIITAILGLYKLLSSILHG